MADMGAIHDSCTRQASSTKSAGSPRGNHARWLVLIKAQCARSRLMGGKTSLSPSAERTQIWLFCVVLISGIRVRRLGLPGAGRGSLANRLPLPSGVLAHERGSSARLLA